MTTVTVTAAGTFNADLADRVVAQITAHPETWDQRDWHCDTGMCFGGWAIQLAGLTWVPRDRYDLPWVLVPTGTSLADAAREDGNWPDADDDHLQISAGSVARHLLGLNHDQANALFTTTNKLTDIRRILNEIAAPQPPSEEEW